MRLNRLGEVNLVGHPPPDAGLVVPLWGLGQPNVCSPNVRIRRGGRRGLQAKAPPATRPPSLAYGCYAETATGGPLLFFGLPGPRLPTWAIDRGAELCGEVSIDARPGFDESTGPVDATEFVPLFAPSYRPASSRPWRLPPNAKWTDLPSTCDAARSAAQYGRSCGRHAWMLASDVAELHRKSRQSCPLLCGTSESGPPSFLNTGDPRSSSLEDPVRGASDGGRTSVEHVRVDHRRADVLVAQQLLYRPDVAVALEEVRGDGDGVRRVRMAAARGRAIGALGRRGRPREPGVRRPPLRRGAVGYRSDPIECRATMCRTRPR